LANLIARLFNLRSGDSSGDTMNSRARSALNLALDRLAGDVPEALVPDEEHIVLYADVDASSSDVAARLKFTTDRRVLEFVDTAGAGIADGASLTTWRPTITGEWDGIMHLEVTDPDGVVHRRQSMEWWKDTSGSPDRYYVSLDRPWRNITDTAMKFRIHQPEFYIRDDAMELLEPGRIWDGTKQQVWAIDTAGASRQDMIDFQGDAGGRPYRMWRGRHFQIPAPTEAPQVVEAIENPVIPDFGVETDPDPDTNAPNIGTSIQPKVGSNESVQVPSASAGDSMEATIPSAAGSASSFSSGAAGPSAGPVVTAALAGSSGPGVSTLGSSTGTTPLPDAYQWHETDTLREGTWAIRYTYVWGRRDEEWQQSPLVTPGSNTEQDSTYDLTWAYEPASSVVDGVNQYSGVHDPTWESAPSPATIVQQTSGGALVLSATNIDAMLGFGRSADIRFGRTGLRIRYYVAHLGADGNAGELNSVETNFRYHLLCEVEPTYDQVSVLTTAGTTAPASVSGLGRGAKTGGRIVWNGDQLYDYHRPLKHSTGYYAWKVYPHQDSRYELDFRVLRLPRKFVNDQDTAPIQRDAVPALLELALHYIALADGNDQLGAQAHLSRYQDLARSYRARYANPGGVIEPVPITGYFNRHQYGKFSVSE
jgi:hypothetical protein